MTQPSPTRSRWTRSSRDQRAPAERARSLKETIYASFTGLAVVTVLALDEDHTAPATAFLTLFASILGITIAGFVAEVVGYQIGHAKLPARGELLSMGRIALGALVSASVPLVALAAAWIGWVGVDGSLQVGIGIYFVTLSAIAVFAARRTGLPLRQQLVALGTILGLAVVVVAVLVVAHLM